MTQSTPICGVDIGGTKIEAATFDHDLQRIQVWKKHTPRDNYTEFLTAISDVIQSADAAAGQKVVTGISLPGAVDQSGASISVHVPCINGRNLADDISAKLGREIIFDNDVKTFALSEAQGGAGDDARVMLGVILGTGVAGALCVDGMLYGETRGIAGEYGHIALAPDLIKKHRLKLSHCICGATGCAEHYLSGPSLVALGRTMGTSSGTAEELVALYRTGDDASVATFSVYVECLAYILSRLILLFGPNVIVLGGGLSNVRELYDLLPSKVDKFLFDGVETPKISPPVFGATSGARGAAILCRQEIARLQKRHD